MILSKTESREGQVKTGQITTFVADMMALFKGIVLIANVLPVFIGFWLALVFTNISFSVNVNLFFLTIIGSTLVMAGALVLNNWYEVDLDTAMDRTQIRPTVTGRISLKAALILGIVLSIIGFVFLAFTTWEAVLYAFIGWFTYVIMYTMWTKRKYTFNTIVGSISGAVTPLIGWAAVASVNHIVPIVLFMILFIWQMPHTFAIAMKRHDEYKAAGVAMLPVIRGFEMTKRQMFVYVACLLPFPFFLAPLGTAFIIVSTLMNLAWLGLVIRGFFVKDDIKWARINFVVSVNYIAIIFIMMFLVTL
ncbi:heme o synthase [Bacillus norwichensis]|uniref:Protoheme IX farnesyltransferase n=1 Tax=Bacillus norwichensis TaxID=2762217 RepID=A0ABR8VIZ6_9BACI|nr:heme o synthase [Bacillus norwichensis]MBD8004734.1 protoheme IX farnesyltransferase [Bacillus norwichensis]